MCAVVIMTVAVSQNASDASRSFDSDEQPVAKRANLARRETG